MKGINKVILVCTLGKDPEMRSSAGGSAITNITAVTSEAYKDKNSGEKIEKSEWHRVVFFNRLAEIAGEYLKKGSQVYIEGALRTRKWQDKDGKDQYTTEIVANEMQMLGGRSDQPAQPQRDGINIGSTPPNSQPRQEMPPTQNFDSLDDDLPF